MEDVILYGGLSLETATGSRWFSRAKSLRFLKLNQGATVEVVLLSQSI